MWFYGKYGCFLLMMLSTKNIENTLGCDDNIINNNDYDDDDDDDNNNNNDNADDAKQKLINGAMA